MIDFEIVIYFFFAVFLLLCFCLSFKVKKSASKSAFSQLEIIAINVINITRLIAALLLHVNLLD